MRHIADLIEDNCPAIGQFKFTRSASFRGAGECSVDIAEKLTPQLFARNGAAVHRYGRLIPPLTAVVDGLGHGFFIGFPVFRKQARRHWKNRGRADNNDPDH